MLLYILSAIVNNTLANKISSLKKTDEQEVNMEITDIKIRKIITEGRLRAVISITLDDMIAIHDIKIVNGDERLFVAMPSRKDESGIFRDIVHPISPQAREIVENEILDAYNKYIAVSEADSEL